MGVKVVSVAQQSNEPAPNGSFLPSTPSMLSSIIIAPPLGVDNQVDYFRGAGIKQKKHSCTRLRHSERREAGRRSIVNRRPACIQLAQVSRAVLFRASILLRPELAGAMYRWSFFTWQISCSCPVAPLARPTRPFLKVPYNPILGETHHVTAGDLNLIAEQVRF